MPSAGDHVRDVPTEGITVAHVEHRRIDLPTPDDERADEVHTVFRCLSCGFVRAANLTVEEIRAAHVCPKQSFRASGRSVHPLAGRSMTGPDRPR
jgi:hypothetical protein